MPEFNFDVAIRITPASIKKIESEVSSAFANIKPTIDITQINASLKNLIDSMFEQIPVALKQLTKGIKGLEIKIDRIEAGKQTVKNLKEQLKDAVKNIEAVVKFSTEEVKPGDTAGPLGSLGVEEQFKIVTEKAAEARLKLIKAEEILRLLTNNDIEAITAVMAAHDAHAVAIKKSTLAQKSSQVSQKIVQSELGTVGGEGDEKLATKITTQLNKRAKELKRRVDLLKNVNKADTAIQIKILNALRKKAIALSKSSLKKLSKEFEENQKTLNKGIKVAGVEQKKSTNALKKLQNERLKDLKRLSKQFVDNQKSLSSGTSKSTEDIENQLRKYIINLVKSSTGLKKLSDESLRAAKATLVGIEKSKDESEARVKLTKALLRGRDVLERLKQVNLIEEWKKLKSAVVREAEASKKRRNDRNRGQADKLVNAIATNNRKVEKERGKLFIASVAAENIRRAAIKKVIVGLNKTAKSFASTNSAEVQLAAEIKKRIIREQKAGRLPTDKGGKAGGAIGGDVGAISGFGQKLNTKEFERLKIIIGQVQLSFKKLAAGEKLGRREATKFDVATKKLAISLKKTNRGLRQGARSAITFADRVKRATQTVLAFAGPTAVIFGFVNVVKQAVTQIKELDSVSRRLIFFEQAGSFVDVNSSAKNFSITTKELSQTTNKLLDISIRTGLAIDTVSQAMTVVTRIGQKSNSQFAEAVLTLLALEGAALSTEKAVTLLNAVQIQFLRGLDKLSKGIADAAIKNIANDIAVTAAQSAFNVEQLTNALTRVGPALVNLQDLTVGQSIALIGEVANVTGADVGRLSTTLRQMTTLVVQNAAEIERTSGVTVLDNFGDVKGFKSIIDVLRKIKEASDAGSASAVALALKLGDRRNVAAILGIAAAVEEIAQKIEDAGDIEKRIDRARKAAIATLVAQQSKIESIDGTVQKLSATFTKFVESPGATEFLVESLKLVIDFIEAINEVTADVKKFTEELLGIGEFGKTFGARNTRIIDEIKSLLSIIPFVDFAVAADSAGRTGRELEKVRKEANLWAAGQEAANVELALSIAEAKKKLKDDKISLKIQNLFIEKVNELVEIQKQLNILDLDALKVTKLRQRALNIIKDINQTGQRNLEKQKKLNESLVLSTRLIFENRKKEELALKRIEVLQTSAAGFLSGRETINLKFKLDKSAIDREIKLLDDEIKNIKLEFNATGFNKESKNFIKSQKEIEELKAKQNELSQKKELLNIQKRRDISKDASNEFKTQIDVFEKSSQNIISAFTKVISLQKGLADLLSQQGALVVVRIQDSAKSISTFLEVSGASVEIRLRSVRNQAAIQLTAVKRIGDAQLRGLRKGIDTDSFIDIDDLQVRTDALIGIIRTGIQSVARIGESEQTKQARELFNEVRKIRVSNANAEFSARISAARNEIEIRKNILGQEIDIIKKRIQAEKALNEIRKKQQEEFGRLLIKSPEQFKETINDIRNATRFFRGITDINIGGLEQIFNRIKGLRQAGGTEALQSILRGIQAGGQFGKEIAPGVGSKQLQSAFERLQLNLPEDVKALFESQAKEALLQTELQKKIRLRSKEQARLAQFNFRIQEAQLKISIAEISVAQDQRNRIIRAIENSSNTFKFQFEAFREQLSKELEKEKGLERVFIGDNKEFSELFEQTKNSTDSLKEWNIVLKESKKLIQEKEDAEPERKESTTINSKALEELSQKLRPLNSGRLQIVDPAIEGLRKEIKKTGGTRDERNELRRLEIESRRTIGGGSAEAQGKTAARRFLKDEDVLEGISEGLRNLLEDISGGFDTFFVEQLRDLKAQKRIDPQAVRELLGEAGLTGTAAKITTRGKARDEVNSLLDLSDEFSENVNKITREAAKGIQKIVAAEIAQGIRDIKDAAIINVGFRKGNSTDRAEARRVDNQDIAKVMEKGFSIGTANLVSELKSTFDNGAKEITTGIKAAFIASASELGDIIISINSPEITHKINLSIGNSITAEDFARTLAIELSNVGISLEEVGKLVEQIQSIAEPLIKAGVISRSIPRVPGPTSLGPF